MHAEANAARLEAEVIALRQKNAVCNVCMHACILCAVCMRACVCPHFLWFYCAQELQQSLPHHALHQVRIASGHLDRAAQEAKDNIRYVLLRRTCRANREKVECSGV